MDKHQTSVSCFVPDTGLGEPGLVPDGRHSCVHQWVGLDELQGVVRELDGAFIGSSWTVTCTAPGSRIKDTSIGSKVRNLPSHVHNSHINVDRGR